MPVSLAEIRAGRLRPQPPPSVMDTSPGPAWQPEYEKEPPLEAPMLSPDDLIGSGIPTKAALAVKALVGGAKAAVPMLAGTFVGRQSSPLLAEQVVSRLRSGERPEKVWRETGAGVAPWDREFRQEIDDSRMRVNEQLLRQGGLNRFTDVVEHPELIRAFPRLRETRVMDDPSLDNALGAYSTKQDIIGINPSIAGDRLRSTLIHEPQHVVQDTQGLSPGGSSWQFARMINEAHSVIDYLNRDMGRVSHHLDKARARGDADEVLRLRKEYDQLMDERDSLVPVAQADAGELYRALGGEAEARLAQKRMNLTPEARRALYPYDPDYYKWATGVDLNQVIEKAPEEISGLQRLLRTR